MSTTSVVLSYFTQRVVVHKYMLKNLFSLDFTDIFILGHHSCNWLQWTKRKVKIKGNLKIMDQNTYFVVILLSCLQMNLPNSISRFFHYAMYCCVLTVGEFIDYHAPQIQSYSLLLIRKINKHDFKYCFI